jgi:hypothetical protein
MAYAETHFVATVTAAFHQQVKYRATPRGHRYGKPQFHEALTKKVSSLHGFNLKTVMSKQERRCLLFLKS